MTKAIILTLSLPVAAVAQMERYKDESAYLERVSELGYEVLQEDFEGDAWHLARSDYPDNHYLSSVTSKGVTWSSAGQELWRHPGKTALISTNQNWGRGGSWGIFDNYLASSLCIEVPQPIHGVGLWVNTNPDGEDVGFLFRGRDNAADPGYVMVGYGAMYPGDIHPVGHAFVGIIDPAGFDSVTVTGTLEVNEEGQLEGGTVFGADDFAFAVPLGFHEQPFERWLRQYFSAEELADATLRPTLWGALADADVDGLPNELEFALGTHPRNGGDGAGAVALGVEQVGDARLLALTFLRRKDDPLLNIVAETSYDLLHWNSDGMESVRNEDLGSSYERVTMRERLDAARRTTLFGRVRISR